MNLGANLFALLGEDPESIGAVNQPKQAPKKQVQNKQNQEQSRNVKGGAKKQQLNTKAAKVFREKNELSAQEKAQRNKAKKQRKQQKKAFEDKFGAAPTPKAPTAAPAKAPTAATGAPAAKAAPAKVNLAALDKELKQKRDQKVKEYLAAVRSVISGSTVYFKLPLKSYSPQEAKDIGEQLKVNAYKTIGRVVKSKVFLEAFQRALPVNLSSTKVPSAGNVRIARRLTRQELSFHMLSLLTGASPSNSQKSVEEATAFVDGFLEGVFGVPLNQETEDLFADEHVGSAGGHRTTQVSLFDFIGTASANKKGSKGQAKVVVQPETAPAAETAPIEPAKPAADIPVNLDDPTANVASLVRSELSAKADLLGQRVPQSYRAAQISTPVFTGEEKNFGGAGRGKGGPQKDQEQPVSKVAPGSFLWNAAGCDWGYVFWSKDDFVFLFTTGGSAPASS